MPRDSDRPYVRRQDSAPPPPEGHRLLRRAAERRSARPRVETYVNELSGVVSWRTVRPARFRAPRAATGGDAGLPEGRVLAARPQAAALRSAGLDPRRVPARGAAPVPTHPATVQAVAHVPLESLPPDLQRAHLARVGMLRSQVVGDVSRGARMPSAVAARLRSVVSPAHVHALSAAQARSQGLASRGAVPAVPGRTPAAGGPAVPARRR